MTPFYTTLLNIAEQLSEPVALHDEFVVADMVEITEWLRDHTQSVVLALCSLGADIDSHLQQLSQDDIVSATILNEIALAWIVAITKEIHGEIRHAAQARGLKAGPAYRPGVGRWPLEIQQIVFSHLPTDRIGVTLSEEFVMMPALSTSLIIPIMNLPQERGNK